MSEDLRYPIVMSRFLFCSGKCQRHTDHHSVIYPDVEHNTCKVCGHKVSLHYTRQVAVVYKDVDIVELEGIMGDLNDLGGKIISREFGKMGKSDKAFVYNLTQSIFSIRKRVERLRNR